MLITKSKIYINSYLNIHIIYDYDLNYKSMIVLLCISKKHIFKLPAQLPHENL